MNDNSSQVRLSPFGPVLLLALSLVIFFVWTLIVGIRQRATAIRMRDQQDALVLQTAQAEERLKSLMMDLLDLSKTDDEAKAIVKKFNVSFNPGAQTPLAPPSPEMPLPTNAVAVPPLALSTNMP